MVGLPNFTSEPLWTRATKGMRRTLHRFTKSVMRSHKFKIPKYDMPLRLRPWFLLFTSLIMLVLAFLGFTDFSHQLPLNDKLLHFFCLGIATGVFYFIFDVEEDARRVWFWRTAPLIITGVVCFLFGGIFSEFVQSLIPHKQFQWGDVIANLLGSSLGLCVAYYVERYYRHRREISRLYRPLDAEYSGLSDDEDDMEQSTQLLPTHYQTSSQNGMKAGRGTATKVNVGHIRLADVWDEREEVFGIGDDSDEDDEDERRRSRDAGPPLGPGTPKIVVTGS